MTEINLLPIDLSSSRGSVKFAEGLKKLIPIFVGIFVIASVLSAVLLVFLTSEINSSHSRQSSLKQDITSLQKTEQQILLIKDRIGKINSLNSNTDAADTFANLDKTFSALPSGVNVSTVEITSDKTKFSVVSKDSLGMATFLNSIVTSGLYKSLILVQFSFTPGTGYTIGLEVS